MFHSCLSQACLGLGNTESKTPRGLCDPLSLWASPPLPFTWVLGFTQQRLGSGADWGRHRPPYACCHSPWTEKPGLHPNPDGIPIPGNPRCRLVGVPGWGQGRRLFSAPYLLWTPRLTGGDPGELMVAGSRRESCTREGEYIQMGDVCVLISVVIGGAFIEGRVLYL